MRKHKRLWEGLPPGVVSGDETDHRGSKNRYVITSLPWRAAWIRGWMIVFDRLHLATRFTASGRATPGAFPHIRTMPPPNRLRKETNCDPVRSLPRNFYNPAWLARQSDWYLEWLDIQPEIDLNFPEELLRYDFFGISKPHSLSIYFQRIAESCRYVTSHFTPPIPLRDIPVGLSRNRQPPNNEQNAAGPSLANTLPFSYRPGGPPKARQLH
jgi:hypothetical protein